MTLQYQIPFQPEFLKGTCFAFWFDIVYRFSAVVVEKGGSLRGRRRQGGSRGSEKVGG